MTDYTREIDVLKKAIATGARRVIFDGRSIEFETFDKLLERLAWLENQQNPAASGRVNHTLGQFSRGDY